MMARTGQTMYFGWNRIALLVFFLQLHTTTDYSLYTHMMERTIVCVRSVFSLNGVFVLIDQ